MAKISVRVEVPEANCICDLVPGDVFYAPARGCYGIVPTSEGFSVAGYTAILVQDGCVAIHVMPANEPVVKAQGVTLSFCP